VWFFREKRKDKREKKPHDDYLLYLHHYVATPFGERYRDDFNSMIKSYFLLPRDGIHYAKKVIGTSHALEHAMHVLITFPFYYYFMFIKRLNYSQQLDNKMKRQKKPMNTSFTIFSFKDNTILKKVKWHKSSKMLVSNILLLRKN
jgi:hypothetical protein